MRLIPVLLLFAFSVAAHAQVHATKIALILPFENRSKAPGVEWVSESFPEVLGQSLSKGRLFVVSRNERQYAFDRLGVPTGLQLSRATLLRIAQEMDVDYIIQGSYGYDGRAFSSRAQVMDVSGLKLSNDMVETGPIAQTIEIESALAADLAREIEHLGGPPAVRSASIPVRLDALENYMKGLGANGMADRIRFLKEAVRISPGYFQAVLALGKTYFDYKDHEQAIMWLAKIPPTDPRASEANFFLGLAASSQGNLQLAENAFRFTSRRLPLIEVINDLGVVLSRRGSDEGLGYFERAVNADARDPDYHFNLGVAAYRKGDTLRAQHELKAAAALNPEDTEAKTFLQTLSSGLPLPTQQVPLERIKRNYDESSYRQVALEIQNVNELRYQALTPLKHAEAHVVHGNELLMQGALDQAESDFREAIILDPANALAHAGLAEVLEDRDEVSAAQAEANVANTLGLSAQALLVLARIEIKQQRPAVALDLTHRVLKIEPNNTRALEMQRRLGGTTQP